MGKGDVAWRGGVSRRSVWVHLPCVGSVHLKQGIPRSPSTQTNRFTLSPLFVHLAIHQAFEDPFTSDDAVAAAEDEISRESTITNRSVG